MARGVRKIINGPIFFIYPNGVITPTISRKFEKCAKRYIPIKHRDKQEANMKYVRIVNLGNLGKVISFTYFIDSNLTMNSNKTNKTNTSRYDKITGFSKKEPILSIVVP
jgi:hypothetical protein